MNRRILRMIALILTILLAVLAALFIFKYSRESNASRKELAERYESANEQLVKLMAEKTEQERLLAEMDKSARPADDHMGSVVFLFTEPKKELLTKIVPEMDKYDYVGVIAISVRYYPGVEGCLDWNEIKELTDKGWELCVRADDVNDVDMLKAIFRKGDVPLPGTVYYPQDKCSRTEEQIWLSDGFTTVIEYDGEVTDIREEGLWHMPAYGSRLEDSQVITKSYYTRAQPVALTVGFENSREMYTKVNFDAMLSAINGYEKSGDVYVTNVTGAGVRYRIHMVNSEDDPEYSEADREKVIRNISRMEEQIRQLRKQENDRQ